MVSPAVTRFTLGYIALVATASFIAQAIHWGWIL
jgi:hypothetical protein